MNLYFLFYFSEIHHFGNSENLNETGKFKNYRLGVGKIEMSSKSSFSNRYKAASSL